MATTPSKHDALDKQNETETEIEPQDDDVVEDMPGQAGKRGLLALVSTAESGSQPLLFFPYPSFVQLDRACPPGYAVRELAPNKPLRMTFAFKKRYMYNAMRAVFKTAGLQPTHTSHWNLYWGQHLTAAEFAALQPHQRVNHFPGSFELGRKDRLCANLLRMRKRFPAAYADLIPETYLTGNVFDKQQFLAQCRAEPQTLWILKPPNLSCGRGIKLVRFATTPRLPQLLERRKHPYVVQRYIAQPMLIHDLKFDLRLYVLVTGLDPLRIYLFHDGLVRFCTEKYSTDAGKTQNPFGHLTNYSVNKKNTAAFQPNNEDDASLDPDKDGQDAQSCSKWSLQTFLAYVEQQGQSALLPRFHANIADLVVKTVIAVESRIAMASAATTRANAFELYGFDVLLEGETMKPWLLEVNVFPSLSSSSKLDKRIKTVLVSDVFQLIGVPIEEASEAARTKTQRLQGVASATKKKPRRIENIVGTPVLAIDQLDSDDLTVIKAMEEEELRRGHFTRIFPTPESYSTYSELFETPRYKTTLCMRWLQAMAQPDRRTRRSSSNQPRPQLPTSR